MDGELYTYVPQDLYIASAPTISTFGGQGDFAELMELLDSAEQGVQDIRETGCQYALNRQTYEINKAKRFLELLNEGKQVTAIPHLVQGFDDVNQARMLKDASLSLNDAAKEAVNVAKLKARIIESQINREWYQR